MLFILKNQFYAKYLSSDIYRLIFYTGQDVNVDLYRVIS